MGSSFSTRDLCVRATVCTLTILATAGAAAMADDYGMDHIFVYDNVWWDADVLEYTADGTFVRSFQANLPEGYRMSGLGHLRWGPDGRLYQFGELDSGSGGMTGVFEWGAGGTLLNFYQTPEFFTTGGFAVLDNGNWAINTYDGSENHLREYARDFSQYWDFTDGDLDNQGLWMHDGLLYNVQNHQVVVWDPATRQAVGSFLTSEDNDDLAVSDQEMVAVNFQWHDPARADYVEVVDILGASLASATMPDNDLRTRGIGFLSDGTMLVTGGYYDLGGSGVWEPKLAVFDNTLAFVELVDLAGWREPGSIAVSIPEPATMTLLACGAIAMLRRKR